MIVPLPTSLVMSAIATERIAQNAKWGEQNHPDGTGRPGDQNLAGWARMVCQANVPDKDNWRDILQEEISEAFAESNSDALRAELVQVAAVAAAWIEAIDRRTTTQEPTDGDV